MIDTKECPNCGKWMIKWFANRINPVVILWKCACGHEELIEEMELAYKAPFEKAWQEVNKEEKS